MAAECQSLRNPLPVPAGINSSLSWPQSRSVLRGITLCPVSQPWHCCSNHSKGELSLVRPYTQPQSVSQTIFLAGIRSPIWHCCQGQWNLGTVWCKAQSGSTLHSALQHRVRQPTEPAQLRLERLWDQPAQLLPRTEEKCPELRRNAQP